MKFLRRSTWCNISNAYSFNSRVILFGRNLSKSTKSSVTLEQLMSTSKAERQYARECMKDIFSAAVKAVSPKAIIESSVDVDRNRLYIGRKHHDLKKNVYLVGFGKAVMGMAIALHNKLGDRVKKGIVSVPKVSKDALWSGDDNVDFPFLSNPIIDYREGSLNNQPDERSLETTHEIMDLVEALTENDTLIVLVSGGGSALLYMPRPVIDADDKLHLCKTLQNAGASIQELNIVRRKLSLVKGGGLARIAYPANVITLILSDIVGDPIDLIASGPTVYSPKAPDEVVAVLKKYDLFDSLEGDLKKVITAKESFKDAPLLTKTKEFKHVTNRIIANNSMAIKAAKKEAQRKDLTPIVLRNDVQGDVHDVSLAYAEWTHLMCLALDRTITKQAFFDKVSKLPIIPLKAHNVDDIFNLIENIDGGGVLLIGGGEPTVTVKGKGKGGRNQELALHFAMDWLAKIKQYPRLAAYDVMMFSGGTDGQDGPTDAAGAFGYAAMGPIVYNLYTRLKSMMTIEVAKAEAKKAETVEPEEKEPTPVPCKTEVLSGYITLGRKETQESSDEVEKSFGGAQQAPGGSQESTDKNNEEDTVDIHPLILKLMEVERMLPEDTLAENDTYNFYSRFYKGIDLVKTGFTGTNVMDLHFIHIKRRKCGCEIDFATEHQPEDAMDVHDLHIDPETIEKYRRINKRYTFDKYPYLGRSTITVVPKKVLNLTITDENLADPCCNKKRKIPKS